MNPENSKMSKPHVLVLKLTNKLDLRIGEKILPYQILAFITLITHLHIYYIYTFIAFITLYYAYK